MARIVDPNPSPDAEKQIKCYDGCGAIIAYIPSDIKKHHGDGEEYIVCPRCEKEITLYSW